ncbi:cellulase family glycosylhydrolase [Mucilaginibacter robiniae]|uniref:Cellulase family glycosylhydrolase n=1 Tax=Mucilaginibacter robiniae TaxID=2728022 RepID=A0A7L5E3K8_9SPHI|nr:cellulase family glycosylhydrolase [Mucilaginibacter robiniae]QJD96997.1 cellulase family glycosylhydrolase [Mucilaginibacter robiniae]
MRSSFKLLLSAFWWLLTMVIGVAQTHKPPTYVDAQGIFRWTKDKSPVYLFGVNYTAPFAYGYRSIKALNINVEKEIDQDVYHLARMGVDAFRVHVWDTEISDSLGNLKNNEHLRLFDYLLSKLEARGIRAIITPIAFWGNGYPEQDEHTGSFSDKYGKNGSLVNEQAFVAQERYLKQLFSHMNPYTHKTYTDDDFIIATEINNEPHPSGSKERATQYINRMMAAIKSTGWNKPVFYNISESPAYADAVAKSNVNGFSFQWYPIGLVAGHEQKGNFLPNVDRYTIPYDTIPQFKNKARMVYEFDAADILQSCIYPAVARSFKAAGFQWVTQFAYDPMATAYGNTEYQTHFLNLAYTPGKAISLLIANRVFHQLPRNKAYGSYPADSVFDAYHVSYSQNMSEMNTAKEFYYSGATSTQPIAVSKLEHVAGIGSSPIVKYAGYGAYFIDKLENGVWRLEVMPDAITVRDPFERPSPDREAVHIQWSTQPMQLTLSDLGANFAVKGINAEDSYQTTAQDGHFDIQPGTYLLTKRGKNANKWTSDKRVGYIRLDEFVAPKSRSADPYVTHTPLTEVSTGKAITINAKIINIDSADKVTLVVNRGFGPWVFMSMNRVTPYYYSAVIPDNQVTTGVLSYHIIIQRSSNTYWAFPSGHQGNPYAWNYTNQDSWQTFVAAPHSSITLFNATTDKDKTNTYYPDYSREGGVQYVSGTTTGQLALQLLSPTMRKNEVIGFQLYVGNKLKGRLTDLPAFGKIVVRARAQSSLPAKLRIALTLADASTYATYIDLSDDFKYIEIPLAAFKPDSSLLLPRPYPGFMPLWFKASHFSGLNLIKVDKLEVTAGNDVAAGHFNQPLGIQVESVFLKQ